LHYDERSMKRWLLLAIAVLAPVATADARPASTGFFAEGGLGGMAVIPKRNVDPGPSITLRVGRDLFSWLSLGVFVGASSHEATVPPPPEDEWFQLYRTGADARVGGLIGSVALFAEGGIGAGIMSSNILEKVMIVTPGQRYSVMFHGGGGIEYQLENRHYAFGAAVDAFLLPQFDNIKAIDTRLYLRYTYGGG
jgi:hypothetical protein